MENVTGRESLGSLEQAVLEGALWIDAEADELCGAKRYERSVERLDARWLRVSSFGIRHSFVIRASPFVISNRLSLALSARRRPGRFAVQISQISAFFG
jgi:hypothetical protein